MSAGWHRSWRHVKLLLDSARGVASVMLVDDACIDGLCANLSTPLRAAIQEDIDDTMTHKWASKPLLGANAERRASVDCDLGRVPRRRTQANVSSPAFDTSSAHLAH